MYSPRAALLALAVFFATAGTATAQSSTAASPGLYSLGLGLPLGNSWGLRSDYTPGFKWLRTDGSPSDVGLMPDNPRSSLYADWFPFTSNGFRVVGGLTLNDSAAGPFNTGLGAYGYGVPGNGYGPLRSRPTTSTYLGVGYSQLGETHRGLGFYADMGVTLGSLATETESSASPATSYEGWRVQNNGWLGFRYLPSVSLGLIYRY